jgi:hypothetical protein
MIRTVLSFIFRLFGPLWMIYLSRISVSKRVPTKCGAVRICGAGLNIVTKCGAGLNQRYWILEYYAKHCGSTADLPRARWVDSCGPIVYKCFFADLLRICCGSTASSLLIGVSLQIYCGSTAGSLFIGASRRSAADLLRMYCGSTAGPLFIGVSLRIYYGSTAGRRARCTLRAHCLKVVLCGFTAGRCF